jgi:hypothetical protein
MLIQDRPYKTVTYVKDVTGTIKAIIAVANQPENLQAVTYYANYLYNCGYEALFNLLKTKLKFRYDPAGIEYIQGAKSLLETGEGDCDCFVCLMCSILFKAQKPFNILLYGNFKEQPSHIAVQINNSVFDLTAPKYNLERLYKFRQIVPILT